MAAYVLDDVDCACAGPADAAWLQWGGPRRNFMVESGKLAVSGPLADRNGSGRAPLGEGHSAILVENGRLYTMYRQGGAERIAALDAATGKAIWE